MARIREGYITVGGGGHFDTDKAIAWGVNRLWYEHDDPQLTENNLKAILARGVPGGIKVNGDGAEIAQLANQRLIELGFGASTGPYTCGVQMDEETHRWDKIEQSYDAFRALRKTRYLQLTWEPWQEGDIPPSLIQKVNVDQNCLVVVQGYMDYQGDQLYPAYIAAAIIRLWRAGFLMDRLTAYLPVKAGVQVPFGWEGIWWKFDTLPARPPAVL